MSIPMAQVEKAKKILTDGIEKADWPVKSQLEEERLSDKQERMLW